MQNQRSKPLRGLLGGVLVLAIFASTAVGMTASVSGSTIASIAQARWAQSIATQVGGHGDGGHGGHGHHR
jgi:hypothetical protein